MSLVREAATVRFQLDKLALAVGPVVLCSLAGKFVTTPQIDGWYATLIKPAFNPPNWAFPVAWTLLFALMAYAVYRVLKWPASTPWRTPALFAFYAQLALNAGWSAAFFGQQSPLLGLVVIAPFLALILLTIRLFNRIDPFASWLLWPYAAWVSYATVLNVAIYALNR